VRRAKVPVLPGQQLLLARPDFDGPTGLVALEKLKAKATGCQLCALCESRTRVVFGVGPHDRPKLAIVGEGPGASEDDQGEPFVGRSGALLTRMLAAAGVRRADVFITNAVLCRPDGNRTPTAAELDACKPFLEGQLRAVNPKAILALGKTAAMRLTGSDESVHYMRGRWHKFGATPVRVSWHPAYILRRDAEDGGKARWEAWDDLCAVLEHLGLPVPEKTRPGAE